MDVEPLLNAAKQYTAELNKLIRINLEISPSSVAAECFDSALGYFDYIVLPELEKLTELTELSYGGPGTIQRAKAAHSLIENGWEVQTFKMPDVRTPLQEFLADAVAESFSKNFTITADESLENHLDAHGLLEGDACPECHGTGKYHGFTTIEDCKACSGSGKQ